MSSHVTLKEETESYPEVALATSWCSPPSPWLGSHCACRGYCSVLHHLPPLSLPLFLWRRPFLSSAATAIIDADLYNALLTGAAIMFVLTRHFQGCKGTPLESAPGYTNDTDMPSWPNMKRATRRLRLSLCVGKAKSYRFLKISKTWKGNFNIFASYYDGLVHSICYLLIYLSYHLLKVLSGRFRSPSHKSDQIQSSTTLKCFHGHVMTCICTLTML